MALVVTQLLTEYRSLSAALSVDQREQSGITHVISVCPNYPSTGEQHLSIPVHDTEYEDLLIHLPKTCGFIQAALDQGGKVLVHCVMGISRSTTVVAAYRKCPTSSCHRPLISGFCSDEDEEFRCEYGTTTHKAA